MIEPWPRSSAASLTQALTRMARSLALTIVLTLALTGCLREPLAPELADLLKVSPQLMRAAPVGGPLPSEHWPAELKALEPGRVYATPDGIYIVTSTFFIREEGLFLPRAPTFSAQPGTDPEFRRIVDGLYSYKLKG